VSRQGLRKSLRAGRSSTSGRRLTRTLEGDDTPFPVVGREDIPTGTSARNVTAGGGWVLLVPMRDLSGSQRLQQLPLTF